MKIRLALSSVCFLLVTGLAGFSRAQTAQISAPAATDKKELTPESFLELRSLQDPQYSPDGSRIAFVVSDPLKGDKRARHIWIHDKSAGVTRQLTYSEKSETYPRWSPDGKRLAFLSNRGEEQQIYLLRMDGGEAIPLTKAKASVSALAWSPDGNSIAYLASDAKTESEEKKEKDKDDARVVDKDDKHARLRLIELSKPDASKQEERALTPADWKVEELAWAPDGQSLVLHATKKPASDQHTDGIYRVWLRGRTEELREPHGPIGEVKFSPDGKWISFQAARDDGPDAPDLWLLPADGGAARNLTGASLDREIAEYRWAADGSLTVVYVQGFRNQFAQFTRQGEKTDLPNPPINPGPFTISRSGEIAFVGQSATAPQELWLRDSSGASKQVTHINEAWTHYPLVAPEIYKYKSFDGLEIEAALLKPKDTGGKSKLPAIVLVHGGPTGNWEDSIEAWGQLLVARGYVVFYPNIRGSIGYGEKFVEMNRADWGGGDFKDVMAGVDDLIAKGIADPDRLGIGGWSYGGYMAGWAVTQTTRFKAAVAGAGMANLISEYGTEVGPAYDEWFFSTPYEHPERFLNSSPFLFVRNAKTPTLILQGEADPIDPVGQSQELYRGLKRYGVETELVLYPREPHGFGEPKHRVDMQNRMLNWFDNHMKPTTTKSPTP